MLASLKPKVLFSSVNVLPAAPFVIMPNAMLALSGDTIQLGCTVSDWFTCWKKRKAKFVVSSVITCSERESSIFFLSLGRLPPSSSFEHPTNRMARAIRQKIFFVMVLVFKVNNRLYPINAEKMKILHQKYHYF